MAIVTMPQFGESVTEGTVLRWYKQPGDTIALDEPLCEIETEKVTAELPSPLEGTLDKILVAEGDIVDVGAPLCEIIEVGEQEETEVAPGRDAWRGGPMATQEEEVEPEPAAAEAGPSVDEPAPVSRVTGGREHFYSPAVTRLAHEHGVDLASVRGSGAGGRITRKDVEAVIASTAEAAPSAPQEMREAPPAADGGYEVVAQTATRRTIAERMKRSNLEAPQAWTMVEADVTALVRWREQEKQRYFDRDGVELTLLAPFVAAVCESLHDYPLLNSRWEGEELRRYTALNIGIAVASDRGLVVPVIHNARDLSIAGLAREIADRTRRAHSRELTVDDIEGGTFTVNNTGSFGSIASKPIVNYPQVAIVSMERAVKRPVVREDDAIAVRWMMNVCLSFDHRALDGAEAGGFLGALKGRLERSPSA